jgi:hypothetical protein
MPVPDRDIPPAGLSASPAAAPCQCREATAVPVPGPSGAEDAQLAHLYLCERLSTYRIAQLTGQDRQRVARQLRRAGVPLRPRGAGGTRPDRRRADPPGLVGALEELYVRQRLTTAQVGARLGMPGRTVRDRLGEYGIRPRTRGAWQREDRRSLPADALRELYSTDGLPADAVGRKLGASRKAVLRAAHDLGLPVRAGGAVTQAGPDEIMLIDALYGDQLVAAALAEHDIPRVPAGGPIWQRFPEPVPLSALLVTDLYRHCGTGLHHIELVTGQPVETVREFMRRTGLDLRRPGGRSPFLRRWRTSTQPGNAEGTQTA